MYSNENKLIETTADFWSRKAGRPISREDAREILLNVSGFFGILREWDARDRNRPTINDNKEEKL